MDYTQGTGFVSTGETFYGQQNGSIATARSEARTFDQIFATLDRPKRTLLSPFGMREVVTEADIAWAAGFLDGEGSFGIARQTFGKNSKRRATYRFRLSVSQTRKSVLHEFEWAVGIRGFMAAPKTTKKQNHKCYALVYDGMCGFAVIERVYEYLRRKREHAMLARDFRRDCAIHIHPGPDGHSEEIWARRRWYYERMRELNRQG